MGVRIENISYLYTSSFASDRLALSDVSFSVKPNEILAIIGPPGSGKTTLIQHLNGLLKPTRGKIFVDSLDLTHSKTDLSQVRRKVGLVFQFPEIQLFEETVFDDIAFGPRNLGLSSVQVEERVKQAMQTVGLKFEQFEKRSPFQISGGEKRRVAIAGVLAIEPQILVLDEPTVGLDRAGTALIERVIAQYHCQGKMVIFVSHDIDLVARLAPRIIVMNSGKIVFDGSREVLFGENRSLLSSVGFDLPGIPKFMERINEKGYSLRTDLYTIKEAKKELRKYASIK
jgi:energy-coupling factor transport system ATP-binding protein